jgi:protein translocase SecG subunit
MQIVKGILIVFYFIVCLALIVLAMIQSKDDAGLSSTITGTNTNNFFEKNKSNTKEGRQKKWTIILGIVLVVLCIGLGTIYTL